MVDELADYTSSAVTGAVRFGMLAGPEGLVHPAGGLFRCNLGQGVKGPS